MKTNRNENTKTNNAKLANRTPVTMPREDRVLRGLSVNTGMRAGIKGDKPTG